MNECGLPCHHWAVVTEGGSSCHRWCVVYKCRLPGYHTFFINIADLPVIIDMLWVNAYYPVILFLEMQVAMPSLRKRDFWTTAGFPVTIDVVRKCRLPSHSIIWDAGAMPSLRNKRFVDWCGFSCYTSTGTWYVESKCGLSCHYIF